jgi:hypothetical protein
MPLGEVVPGFTDAITLAVSSGVWGEEIDIVRWRSPQAAPETLVSFREDSPDGWGWWFAGLDAAGTWYAVQDESDLLSVRPVAAVGAEEEWWVPTREVVGLRVVSAAWHDTAPGRLGWLSCARAMGGPGTLYTLDVADSSAAATPVAVMPDACGELPVLINQWGDWGFALEQVGDWGEEDGWEETPAWTVLLDPDGGELARLQQGPGGANIVAAGPVGTVWIEDLGEGTPTSFLLSPDGQRRSPVPGLTNGDVVLDARWSPDGSRIALLTFPGHESIRVVDTASGGTVAEAAADPSLRIVDAATGETTAEIDELGPLLFQTCWSSDGRFLLFGHDRDEYGAAGAALAVYDTATAAIAIDEPFREAHYISEIRTFEPASIPIQFTPVEWGVHLEEDWGPGVHTVAMSVNARPLLPDQIEGLGGRLIWTDTVVELCNIGIDDVGGYSVHFGDTFQTVEGCGANPNAMQEAFDAFGLPKSACLVVTVGGVDHEYCAPLS